MIEPANPQPTVNSPQAGITANLAGFMGALMAYLHTRMELLKLEGKASAVKAGIGLASGIGMLILLPFFIALLMVALGFLIYDPPTHWVWFILAVIGAPIALGAVIYGLTKAKVLTLSMPTGVMVCYLFTALMLAFGVYLHHWDKNLAGIFLIESALLMAGMTSLGLLAILNFRKVSLRTTLAELQKDSEWLKNLKTRSLPTSN